MNFVWLHDGIVAREDAVVSIGDRGFTSGDGVFEAMKAVEGVPFALTRHLDRLANSAQMLGLEVPNIDLRQAVADTLAANADRCGALARVRITLTAGAGIASPFRGESEPTLVITADPTNAHASAAKAITVPWPHNERGMLVGAKTTSYADNLAILEYARKRGASEALMSDTQGRLCEGTTSNVTVAYDGRLITPTLATGCLGGVTRQLAIEWGLIEERDTEFADLPNATEVLLSSSTRDLLPVESLDGRALPAPGPLGAEAIAEFARRAAVNADP